MQSVLNWNRFFLFGKRSIFLAKKALHWVQCFEILCCPLSNESKRSSCPYVMCKPSLGLIVPGFGSFFRSLPRERKNYIQYVFSPLISKSDNKFCKRVYSLKITNHQYLLSTSNAHLWHSWNTLIDDSTFSLCLGNKILRYLQRFLTG